MKTVFLSHCLSLPVPSAEPCVLALGCFDGVHLGHRHVILQAKQLAQSRGLKLAVMTFTPHPKEVLAQGRGTVNPLTPLHVKQALLAKLGVEILFIVHFDLPFSRLSAEAFVEQYIGAVQAEHVVAGFDFTYGWGGQGTMDRLEADGKGKFQVTSVPPLVYQGHKISSTRIRALLQSGEVQSIPAYLGDSYQVCGEVTTLAFRRRLVRSVVRAEVTLAPDYTLPAPGTYDVEIRLGNRIYPGMAHVTGQPDGSLRLEIEPFHPVKQLERKQVLVKWLRRRGACEAEKVRRAERVY